MRNAHTVYGVWANYSVGDLCVVKLLCQRDMCTLPLILPLAGDLIHES